MIHEITTMQDVEAFITQVAKEMDCFHPLQDFTDYLCPNSFMRRYTPDEAEIRNKQLDTCFDICARYTPDFFTFLLQMSERIRYDLDHAYMASTGEVRTTNIAYQIDLFFSHL